MTYFLFCTDSRPLAWAAVIFLTMQKGADNEKKNMQRGTETNQ